MFLMILAPTPLTVICSAILFGFAWGFNTPTLAAWTTDLANKNHMGRAMATMYIALEIGIGLGALFAGQVYQGFTKNIPLPFLMSGILAIIAFLSLLKYRQKLA
jgi:predicted MFS family arabinose efflux permease